jgi:glycosyltransferase involved in cell wall biosynthesis
MRILWLKTELLHPIDKGGRIRSYHMLRELKRRHEVTYLTLDDGSAAPDAAERAMEYCTVLERIPFRTTPKPSLRLYGDLLANLWSPLPYAVAKYASAAMRQRILTLAQPGLHDVLVCDFLFPSQNVPTGLPIPTILFQHNVEAAIWRRHADVASHPLRRAYFTAQWRRMCRFERQECHRFDQVIAVSEQDRDAIRGAYGVEAVSAVPTGVDTAFFTASGAPRDPREVTFVGSLEWMPNEDAVEFFATAILPRIRAALPEVTFTVVGRHPTLRLVALATAAPGLNLVGGVPDVRPFMERAGVFVVPMRIGGGTRLKIYEALAMNAPIVSTSIGAEGLPVLPGKHLLMADDPAGFAEAVVRLLTTPAEAASLGQAGGAYVREHFGWSNVASEFAAICEQVLARRERTTLRTAGR